MRIILSFFVLCFSFVNVSAQSEQPSSVVETFRDWTVRCVPQNDKRVCQLVQELAQGQTGQRVLSFVVDTPAKKDGPVNGTILAPFGLTLSSGVLLTIDGVQKGEALSFSTCIPLGCVVPVALGGELIESMKSGDKLGLSMMSISTGQKVNVQLSLAGFTAAFNRLLDL